MTWTAADHAWMGRALQLAERGRYTTHPNPRVGCVLVREGKIIGEGWHRAPGEPHAEVNAISNAGTDVRGADCYVTLEPCNHTGRTPPCTDALIKAGIGRVIAAMEDPFPEVSGRGLKTLEKAGIPVDSGLLAEQAGRLNRGFCKRWTVGLPFVTCKLAMSMDGRTALADGTSKWITGAPARQDVQCLRAGSSAILTGIGTVLADDPRLNVRDLDCGRRQPLRVVIDSRLRFPPRARMLRQAGRTLIMTRSHDGGLKAALEAAGAEVVVIDAVKDEFLHGVLKHLASEKEVNELLVESGATLTGGLLAAGFLDELVIYQAPLLLGDAGKGLFHLPGIGSMNERIPLEIRDLRHVGRDLRLTLTPH
ncbi:MAG: bifunctional diaminohydroxyphosphoribosylaminopyrimidine deaminase/5-amino-6-(5-phosphoribosylamino)uracil reductase RibD [Gammaproteobacteria bacterium]|nr:MAG: bifunctional diaminohydroxyphosphoribosylaminopyrimidine deaminase/5-amino-6-(5-phosphoribosylamino)uracil reductase RibD [Gammaproteobacteria bacterium]